MPAFEAEIDYLTSRLIASVRQGDMAIGQCARTAHEGLATLYRGRLADLRRDRCASSFLSPQQVISDTARLETLTM